jgi:DNA polymerase-1
MPGEFTLELGSSLWFYELKAWLENAGRKTVIVFHNAKFDINMLKNIGIEFKGPFHDTMLLARVLVDDEPSVALKKLADKYIDVNSSLLARELKKELKKSGITNWKDAPADLMKRYAKQDARLTLKLFHMYWATITGKGASRRRWETGLCRVYEREIALVPVLRGMESRGHRIDRRRLQELQRKAKRRVREKRKKLHAEIWNWDTEKAETFNFNSTKQVGGYVYDVLGLQCREYTAKGARSTSRSALEAIEDQDETRWIGTLLSFRTDQKILSTYINPILSKTEQSAVLHCSFNSTGTVTGRFSSSNPNLQNIPRSSTKNRCRDIRSVFIPRDGHRLIYFDYKQIEMAIFAWYAEDENLLGAIREGRDIHTETGQQIFQKTKLTKEQRHAAKTINFAVIYGMQVPSLSKILGVTEHEARQFLSRYYRAFPGVQTLMRDAKMVTLRRGYIKNAFERERHVPKYDAYKALNSLIQGCAADLMKTAMIDVDAMLSDWSAGHLLLTIHDEIVIETEKMHGGLEQEVVNIMTQYSKPEWGESFEGCPLRVTVSETDDRWSEKKEVML